MLDQDLKAGVHMESDIVEVGGEDQHPGRGETKEKMINVMTTDEENERKKACLQ